MKSMNCGWIGRINLFEFCYLTNKKRVAICEMKISRTEVFSFHDSHKVSGLKYQAGVKYSA